MSLTYKQAGVNVKRADRFVDIIRTYAEPTHKYWKGEIVRDIGGFASILKACGVVLGISTDGVGTKVRMAAAMNQLTTVGEDLVAMNANDLWVTMEPETACMHDYYAVGKLTLTEGEKIIQGIAQGCKLAGTALVGGETAEMPIMYEPNEFELAGTIVGIAKSSNAIMCPKLDIERTMGVFGFPSSGVHSNGFSLIHKVFGIDYKEPNDAWEKLNTFYDELDTTLGDELMKPTLIYPDKISRLRRAYHIAGLAHVTGGGLLRNIPRILPPNLSALVHTSRWPRQPIFDLIERTGGISKQEMLKTFNCGIGLVAISADDLTSAGAYYIGDVVPGDATLRVRD